MVKDVVMHDVEVEPDGDHGSKICSHYSTIWTSAASDHRNNVGSEQASTPSKETDDS